MKISFGVVSQNYCIQAKAFFKKKNKPPNLKNPTLIPFKQKFWFCKFISGRAPRTSPECCNLHHK